MRRKNSSLREKMAAFRIKGERGFTLIELVMVIVIIGVIASVAIPRFSSLRKDAQQAACDGNASAIRGAIAAYYAKTAITPTWDASIIGSGYPPALNDSGFLGCFISGTIVPNCPLGSPAGTATSLIYKNRYTPGTGVLNKHTH